MEAASCHGADSMQRRAAGGEGRRKKSRSYLGHSHGGSAGLLASIMILGVALTVLRLRLRLVTVLVRASA